MGEFLNSKGADRSKYFNQFHFMTGLLSDIYSVRGKKALIQTSTPDGKENWKNKVESFFGVKLFK